MNRGGVQIPSSFVNTQISKKGKLSTLSEISLMRGGFVV